MSACYPRLGQNTPLVQKREKKKRRDSLTNKHSTRAAPHSHYAKTHRTSHSLCNDKLYSGLLKQSRKKKTDEEKRVIEMSKSYRPSQNLKKGFRRNEAI